MFCIPKEKKRERKQYDRNVLYVHITIIMQIIVLVSYQTIVCKCYQVTFYLVLISPIANYHILLFVFVVCNNDYYYHRCTDKFCILRCTSASETTSKVVNVTAAEGIPRPNATGHARNKCPIPRC